MKRRIKVKATIVATVIVNVDALGNQEIEEFEDIEEVEEFKEAIYYKLSKPSKCKENKWRNRKI